MLFIFIQDKEKIMRHTSCSLLLLPTVTALERRVAPNPLLS